MTNELIEQAEAILKDIENETDPLRCCLHYRKMVDLTPKLILKMKDLDYAVSVYRDIIKDLGR